MEVLLPLTSDSQLAKHEDPPPPPFEKLRPKFFKIFNIAFNEKCWLSSANQLSHPWKGDWSVEKVSKILTTSIHAVLLVASSLQVLVQVESGVLLSYIYHYLDPFRVNCLVRTDVHALVVRLKVRSRKWNALLLSVAPRNLSHNHRTRR